MRKVQFAVLAASALLLCTAKEAAAAVVVIANRASVPIRLQYEVHSADQALAESTVVDAPAEATRIAAKPVAADPSTKPDRARPAAARHQIAVGDVMVVPLHADQVMDIAGSGWQPMTLLPNRVYYFGETAKREIELREIGVGLESIPGPPPATLLAAGVNLNPTLATDPAASARLAAQQTALAKLVAARSTIQVAIYGDDDQNARRTVWEPRLKKRIAAASEILKRHCGMELAVKTVGEWESDDSNSDFQVALREFETKVRPPGVRLAIGFTSQYQITRGRTHLGGTRGPLATHILLREWSNHVSESERLELLLHELSHFFGAAHSPEQISVMRPVLGDRQSRARDFRIGIDPVNTLIMNMVAEEMRLRGANSFYQLSATTKRQMEAVYVSLQQALPEDPAAGELLRVLRRR
ncbi:MAG: hypothetical protein SGJ20_14955 [Planctomycetota bacterium]|nr:hypothetical protein [Planctomycetota bacterium]